MLEIGCKLVLAYLLGSVSGSLLLGRFRGVDIRTLGSGNAGGTNALRTQGWRFGLGVVLIDIGKGALAASLGYLAMGAAPPMFQPSSQALACGFVAALGHVYPVFHGFRGGKGAGTLVGVIAVTAVQALLPLLLIFLLVLTTTGYVGLATVCAAMGFALLAFAGLLGGSTELTTFAALCAALLLFTHRANLERLRQGTENRFERVRVLTRWWR